MSFLVALGAVFCHAQKIYGRALRAYKTYLIQKNSPSKKVLYISEYTILKHPENIYFGERSSINGGILSAGGGLFALETIALFRIMCKFGQIRIAIRTGVL